MPKLTDVNGTVHEFAEADVAVVEALGHPVRTVEVGGAQEKAPMATVWLKDGRSFVMEGAAGAVIAQIHRPRSQRSKDGW